MASSFVQPWPAEASNDHSRQQWRRLLPRSIVKIVKMSEKYGHIDFDEDDYDTFDDGADDSPPEDEDFGRGDALADHQTFLLNQHTRVMLRAGGQEPRVQYKYDEWPNYVLDHKQQMRVMLADLFHQELDEVGIFMGLWVEVCFQTWCHVHAAPLRHDKAHPKIVDLKYSWMYHVLVVLQEMRDPEGFKAPIFAEEEYGTAAMYEQPPRDWVVAIPHEPLVKEHYPHKKDLQRIFSKAVVVELSTVHPRRSSVTPRKQGRLKWSNKDYNASVRVLRQCLTDYHRLCYYNHV